MELETLEIFIEANTEKIQAQLAPLAPFFDKVFSNIERITGQSIDKTEKNMDISGSTDKFTKNLDKISKSNEKLMKEISKTNSSKFMSNQNKSLVIADKNTQKLIESQKQLTNNQKEMKKEKERIANIPIYANGEITKIKDINKLVKQTAKEAQKVKNIAPVKMKKQANKAIDSVVPQQRESLKIEPDKVSKRDFAILNDETKEKILTFRNSMKSAFSANKAFINSESNEAIKDIRNQLDANIREIETISKKRNILSSKAQSQKIKERIPGGGGYKFIDTEKSVDTELKVISLDNKTKKLISTNDELLKQYTELKEKSNGWRSALSNLGKNVSKTSLATGNASLGMKKIGKGADNSKSLFSKFGGVFNRTSNNIAHGSRRMTSGISGFNHRLGQMVKQAFVFSVIYKGLQLVSRGLGAALMSNDEFSNSLNQIKVNLLTAFYPIYTFVLPAINAMMRALTVATGQIAHFTASLFGTTYTAAKQGASGLYQNIQAMNDNGNAADKNREKVKKLQRSLMGFDEINRIGLDDDKDDDNTSLDGNKGVNFNTPVPAMPDWINKANGILRDFFKPFQDSWAKHGKTVTDAWKYALGEVNLLARSIGTSFMDVWTNGTGERFISNILLLTASLLNLVGDVAKAFRLAWDENERGNKLIQSLFDALSGILELADELTESFRNAWNENQIGVSIFANLLEILTNVNDTVSNLAIGFKEAWAEGEVGQSIFSTLLTFVDSMLESINKMTEATAVWAKKLDFTPLLKSIDGLLKSIEPLTQNVFDGLAWFYENALLPLAGFVITDAIPVFFDLLGGAIDVVNSVIEVLKPLGKWLWGSFLEPMAEWTGGVIVDVLGNVADGLSGVSDWIDNNHSKIENLAIVVGSFAAAWGLVNGAMTIWNAIGPISTMVTGGMAAATSVLAGAMAILTSPITLVIVAIGSLIAAGVLLWKNWDTISEAAGKLGSWIGEKWDGIKSVTKETWNNVKDKTTEVWDNVSTKVKTKATEAWTNTKDKWEGIKKSTTDNFEEVRKWTVDKWDKVSGKVSSAAGNAKTNATTAWSNMKTNVSTYNELIKTNTDKAFNAVVGWAKDLGGKIGKKLTAGFDAVKEGAKNIGKGIYEFPLKAINGMIDGVAWVLRAVGAKDTAKSMEKYTFEYAQGTGYHPGGMALVNDGYGSAFREAYRLPNGETGLFPNQRNLMVDLPAGSSVLSGPRTASMYGNMPAYAGGVGKWFNEKWNGFKEWTGDVWDYMSNPGKLLEVGISKYTDLKGALEPSLSIAQGAIGTSMKAATSFVKDAMESFFDGGDADTSTSGMMGVMSYLANIATDVMKKFPGMSVTSGYRHGDPHSHGKRQAVDIAFPASMNGSSSYFKPANYAFEKFRDKVAYVITQGKVRDRSGMSGQGTSGQWRHWPENDHYDHLHINGSIAQGQGGGGSSPKGTGVERWRGPINQAANRMRQSITPSQVNGILAQIALESGGNDKIIQGAGVWDENMAAGNPARGLLQYIPSTFNAFRVRGFGQIMNGFHQLMAFFNNSNWRNDIQYGRSGWGPRGHRIQPYAQGTPYMPEDQIALLHKGEMVVPADFNPYNNMADFQTLQLPELFREPIEPVAYVHQPDDRNIGRGVNGLTEDVINSIAMALNMRGDDNQQGGDINITLEVDGSNMANVVVKEINKRTRQQGSNPLLI